ncbi:hypothetical protein BofuT4_uP081900.1 [Botrytis cinerea T4]|uniref:Uncharacterized protein n=1 Tax=Botryotinia fuckeliana (strain T4) TaxID=999810 RepID=G2YK83_BOTF4|nr:hypothetical protein BofuT4_uP081900.1 [Botrytis cinerea T4]
MSQTSPFTIQPQSHLLLPPPPTPSKSLNGGTFDSRGRKWKVGMWECDVM